MKTVILKDLNLITPIYILYSSGTTGIPKCIVHGAGNALIEQKGTIDSLRCKRKR